MKQYSQACEENRDPILAVLKEELAECHKLLEIGSGTGQHAVYFGKHLSHLMWQTSDVDSSHPSINAWLDDEQLPNVLRPLSLDVNSGRWPGDEFDSVFSANTAHIMSWPEVTGMFNGVGRILKRGGLFCLYGPFNYAGQYTSESNERFDNWLKVRDPHSGVRNFEDLEELALECNMVLRRDYEMPVNNRLLVWEKREILRSGSHLTR
jgi:cyclopropane fatty-acyl-phospholipid synthase-like methyltransferase